MRGRDNGGGRRGNREKLRGAAEGKEANGTSCPWPKNADHECGRAACETPLSRSVRAHGQPPVPLRR